MTVSYLSQEVAPIRLAFQIGMRIRNGRVQCDRGNPYQFSNFLGFM